MHLQETMPLPLRCLIHVLLGEIEVSGKKLLLPVATIPTEKEWERKYPCDEPNRSTPCLELPFLGANFFPWALGRCLILIDSEEFYFMFENHEEMGSKLKSFTPPHHPLQRTQTNPRYSTTLKQYLGLAPEAKLVIGSVVPAGSSEVR